MSPTPSTSPTRTPLRRLAAACMTWLQRMRSACGKPAKEIDPRPLIAAEHYRQAAAQHLYARYADRIYAGPLPPMLHAVAALEVHLDKHGHLKRLQWLRAPRHAPDVVQAIEALVRDAAPFPPSATITGVVYTETWLWDRSGQFQLHTLSEGQRGA